MLPRNNKCLHELKLVETHHNGIIPTKGTDITWTNLTQIDLGEDYDLKDTLGLEFNSKKFKQFCEELYEYIKKYKHEVNVFEPNLSEPFGLEKTETEKKWEEIKSFCEKFIKSTEFRVNIEEKLELL